VDIAGLGGDFNPRICQPFMFLDDITFVVNNSHGRRDDPCRAGVPACSFEVKGGAWEGVPSTHAATLPAGTDSIRERHCG
jgi:hypothetical protein